MKKTPLLLIFLLFANFILFAQMGINTGGTQPDPSAGLDVKFTDRGLLPPRMTHAQMDAIVNPANGLIICCLDCGSSGASTMAMFVNGSWNIFVPSCLLPLIPFAGTHAATANQVTWDWNTVADATGYKWNTTNNYSSASDLGTLSEKIETGLACNTAYSRYVWSYNACGNSAPLVVSQSTAACTSGCGSSLTVNHVAGNVAPVTKTVTYGTVTNLPGATSKCWITSNLGADHQATAVNDASEASAGWYWQFNLKQGFKHDGSLRTPATAWYINNNGYTDWTPDNDPCTLELGAGWRIPVKSDWVDVDAGGNWTSWNEPWNAVIKLHGAGYLDTNNGQVNNRGTEGRYWSNSDASLAFAWSLSINSGSSSIGNSGKSFAFTLRCLKDQ